MLLSKFLEFFDFSYEIGKDEDGTPCYLLIDDYGKNLGGIEEEFFYDIPQIADRLDIYYNDYIHTELCEEFGYKGNYDYPQMLSYMQRLYLETNDNIRKKDVLDYLSILDCIVNPEKIQIKERLNIQK
jgi:hypothetical protein